MKSPLGSVEAGCRCCSSRSPGGAVCWYTGGHRVSKLVVEVQRAGRLEQGTQEAGEEVITGEDTRILSSFQPNKTIKGRGERQSNREPSTTSRRNNHLAAGRVKRKVLSAAADCQLAAGVRVTAASVMKTSAQPLCAPL